MAKKRNAIPKKVAGLKMPKALRKSRTLNSLLASPRGREIIANALTAGAAASAAALLSRHDEHERDRGARSSRSMVGEAIHEGSNAIMDVVARAARAVLPEERREPRGPKHAASEDGFEPRGPKHPGH